MTTTQQRHGDRTRSCRRRARPPGVAHAADRSVAIRRFRSDRRPRTFRGEWLRWHGVAALSDANSGVRRGHADAYGVSDAIERERMADGGRTAGPARGQVAGPRLNCRTTLDAPEPRLNERAAAGRAAMPTARPTGKLRCAPFRPSARPPSGGGDALTMVVAPDAAGDGNIRTRDLVSTR